MRGWLQIIRIAKMSEIGFSKTGAAYGMTRGKYAYFQNLQVTPMLYAEDTDTQPLSTTIESRY